jgi:hypothetical protein
MRAKRIRLPTMPPVIAKAAYKAALTAANEAAFSTIPNLVLEEFREICRSYADSDNVQNSADESSSDQSSIDESSKYEVSEEYGGNVRCRAIQAEPAKTRVQNTSEYEDLRARLRKRLEPILRNIYFASWDSAYDAALKAAGRVMVEESTQSQAQQRGPIISIHSSSMDAITIVTTRATSKSKPSAGQHKAETDGVNHSTPSSPQINYAMVDQATRAACFAAARHAVRQLALDTVVSPLGIKEAAKATFEKYLQKHYQSAFNTDTVQENTRFLIDRVGRQSERAFSEHFRRVTADYDTNMVITLDIVTRSTATGICVGARDAMLGASFNLDRELRRFPTDLRMRGNEEKQDSKEAREQTRSWDWGFLALNYTSYYRA